MKKYLLLIIFSSLCTTFSYSYNKKDSLTIYLDKVMENKDLYIEEKRQSINNLRQLLTIGSLSPLQTYDLNEKLYNEYKKYRSDSAVYYMLENQKLAVQINNKELKFKADVQLAWLYSTSGLYIESKDILENIERKNLPDSLMADYYETYGAFCSHYGQSNNSYTYYKKSEYYRDSMLLLLDKGSMKYQVSYATKILYEGKREEAEAVLLDLLNETTDKNEERGTIAYLLGYMYKNDKNTELQRTYFTISAIADIKNCLKDNASLQSLALLYYEMGDIDQAYKFIQSAVDDAVFCNVRYRAVEASAFYPIINASYQAKEKKQKSELQKYLILISILSALLIVGITYVYKQMKRVARIRKELYHTNLKLNELNNDLLKVNNDLQETNTIKEEYIAHFFDLCSAYIDKLEDYRKTLNKKAANNQLDELFKSLKSTTIVENELEELYKNFDAIFLNLYPTFVADFNALLEKEEQIFPKKGELLNTELRIFALIRLGITDSVKIAHFLRYSLRTVYNYRTKVRNKASVSRDDFEEMVKKIGTIQRKND
ncbi:DUF6377 domain-containing protein [Dysgonomonas sp. 25]|uniref:DUF6377 domain-containing protein n=1 Tax=Dysgonomonas sp. 25 TaxID=2302933 RepID=UPI0013D5C334|nr:DUF6377 domain-containing protein [Dysgonomonas sp. 25]NDV70256.1 hypothetical protein [Dysgonomonas sp. 25]